MEEVILCMVESKGYLLNEYQLMQIGALKGYRECKKSLLSCPHGGVRT